MKKEDRKVIYSKERHDVRTGKTALAAAEAKELLGWEECEEKKCQFHDYNAKPVRCTNNLRNRHVVVGWRATLTQVILKKQWRYNRQTIVIGKTGIVEDGQNRLLALVWAHDEWASEKRGPYWKESYWKSEPTIDVLLVTGADEEEETLNSFDQVRPRSLTDVLERSELLRVPAEERRFLARVLDYEVQFLWERTGARKDIYGGRQTNQGSMDFIGRHKMTLDAAAHIHELDKENKVVSKWIGSTGKAAGLLYLMGCSASDPMPYRQSDPPVERKLDWKYWDKACKFWTLFTARDRKFEDMNQDEKALEPVRQAIRGLDDPNSGDKGRAEERVAIICQAWKLIVGRQELNEESLMLDWIAEKEDVKTKHRGHRWQLLQQLGGPEKVKLYLAVDPTVGGIDLKHEEEPEPDPEPEPVTAAATEAVAEEDSKAEKIESNGEDRKAKVAKLMAMRKAKKEEANGDGNRWKQLAALKSQYPGLLLIVKNKRADYGIWGEDADAVSNLLSIKIKLMDGLHLVEIPKKKFDASVQKLIEHEKKPALVEQVDGQVVVRELELEHASQEA